VCVCVDVAECERAQRSTSPASASAAGAAGSNVSVQLPYFIASRQRQLITVAALTAALLFIYDGLQVCSKKDRCEIYIPIKILETVGEYRT